MLRKKAWIRVCLLASFFFVVFFVFFFYKSDSQRVALLAGLAMPGEKWHHRTSDGYEESAEYISGEPKLSPLRGPRNAHIKHRASDASGREIFNVNYFYDNFGRRIVEQNKSSEKTKSLFALFFGCIDLLGPGINSTDTIPALFSKKNTEYVSYNYAFPLSAAQSVNRLAETINFTLEVAEKSGLFIYVITSGHYPRSLERVIPTVPTYMPRYAFENNSISSFNSNEDMPLPTFLSEFEQNRLKYLGTLDELSPVWSKFKMHLSLSSLATPFGPDNIDNYTYSERRLVCALIKTAQHNFLRQFPSSRFIILLHQILPDYERKYLIRCANAARIEYVDAFTPGDFGYSLAAPPNFYHSPLVNNLVVDKFTKYLKTTAVTRVYGPEVK